MLNLFVCSLQNCFKLSITCNTCAIAKYCLRRVSSAFWVNQNIQDVNFIIILLNLSYQNCFLFFCFFFNNSMGCLLCFNILNTSAISRQVPLVIYYKMFVSPRWPSSYRSNRSVLGEWVLEVVSSTPGRGRFGAPI